MRTSSTSPQPQAVERKDKHPADETKSNLANKNFNRPVQGTKGAQLKN